MWDFFGGRPKTRVFPRVAWTPRRSCGNFFHPQFQRCTKFWQYLRSEYGDFFSLLKIFCIYFRCSLSIYSFCFRIQWSIPLRWFPRKRTNFHFLYVIFLLIFISFQLSIEGKISNQKRIFYYEEEIIMERIKKYQIRFIIFILAFFLIETALSPKTKAYFNPFRPAPLGSLNGYNKTRYYNSFI